MTDDVSAPESRDVRVDARFEARLARLEAQVKSHSEQLELVLAGERTRKHRALLVRLFLLVVLLGLLFFVKARGGL